ncbi:hypothetical protein JTB14_028802 [Gonioctena quinquepunctata]|nr:hypothetical protein JTB14_028802 [Gonioctena quinquepunctata]
MIGRVAIRPASDLLVTYLWNRPFVSDIRKPQTRFTSTVVLEQSVSGDLVRFSIVQCDSASTEDSRILHANSPPSFHF